MRGYRVAPIAQPRIEAAFPTWILRVDYPFAGTSLKEIAQLAYDTQKSDPAGNEWSIGNYGLGYTSYGSQIEIGKCPVIATLAAFFLAQAENYARHISVDLSMVSLAMGKIWLNINPKHSYHGEHMHSDAFISGVYYIQTPHASGNTLFRDPRAATAFCRLPFAENTPRNANAITVNPRPGLLIMFPGWLTHSVEQNHSDDDRISLAFNIKLEDLKTSTHCFESRNV